MRLNLVPIKTFKQLKTLYQHDTDCFVLRDKLPNFHLFSNRNSLWDAYRVKDYLKTGNLSLEEINNIGYDEYTVPEFILIKRSHTSFKYIFFDSELDLQLNSGSDIGVFKEVDKKWLKAHENKKKKGR